MPKASSQRVVVLGASPNPDRTAYIAVKRLLEAGHAVVPVHPKAENILGLPVLSSLSEVTGPVDTVTLYVNADISGTLADTLVGLGPGRVIFNPGSENPALRDDLHAANIPTEEACTLVLLGTGQF